jgi:hypothetical protein
VERLCSNLVDDLIEAEHHGAHGIPECDRLTLLQDMLQGGGHVTELQEDVTAHGAGSSTAYCCAMVAAIRAPPRR